MIISKQLLVITFIVSIINLFSVSKIFSMKTSSNNASQIDLNKITKEISETIRLINGAVVLAHNSDTVSLDAFTRAQSTKDTLDRMEKQIKNIASTLKQGGELSESLGKEAQVIIKRIQKEGGEQRQAFATVLNAIKIENGLSMEDREKLKHEDRETEIEKIKEQGEQNRAFEKLKGENSQKILEILNPTTIGVATIAVLLSFYSLKYGFPALIDYWKCPHVISETSRCGFFDWSKRPEIIDINDLIFKPSLQKQLLDLLVRIQTATKYKEALPNVFFYGVPGTGKTSFVKVLAYASGLDYALTSGSEFAKITDLNRANNELRSLLNWAKTSKKGLIVFIDEAESLFANRRLPTISKQTQDFINTFLALISEQSQKKVMFVLATNHPFKMDESVVNRMGISIEFTLPEVIEREKILSMYVSKFAQENKNALIELSSEFLNLIPTYAESLKGFSPRGIKFIAEEMSVSARRQTPMRLTKEIAQEVISKAKSSLQKIEGWDKARNEWLGA